MSENGYRGAKFEDGRDVKETAKLVRQDLKAAVKAGELPDTKYRVFIDRYSMGCSLDVHVGPVPFPIHEVSFVMSDPHQFFEGERWTARARLVFQRVEKMVRAYKRDDSDSMTDYYSVNFSDHVAWAHGVESADRKAVSSREGAKGCSACCELGCLRCAPEGYVPRAPVHTVTAREALEALDALPHPFAAERPASSPAPAAPSTEARIAANENRIAEIEAELAKLTPEPAPEKPAGCYCAQLPRSIYAEKDSPTPKCDVCRPPTPRAQTPEPSAHAYDPMHLQSCARRMS